MEFPSRDDKTGAALKAQRFQMLEDIARELQGDVTFPTCFDVVIRLRKVLNDPDVSLAQVVTMLSAEPLISSKLLQLANSAALNSSGNKIRDLRGAVERLGLKTVRTVAISTAMKQLLLAKEMVCFSGLMTSLWEHSLQTASAAYVVAARFTRINPGEAMLAGLIHDLGAFYMLYRAAQYEELRVRPDTVRYLIIHWHESIGDSLFHALAMDEGLIAALRDHDHPRPIPPVPKNLGDVIFIANILAGGLFEWLGQDKETVAEWERTLGEDYLSLREEIEQRTKEIRAEFV
jgi:HD-like signal output (HDOD) protein